MEKLLIVDDDKGIQKQLKWSLADYDVVLASDKDSAISALRLHEPKVVLLDLGLPPDEANASEGLAALQQILSLAPFTKVIVITGNDEHQVALDAISHGAYDFYQKPLDGDVINVIVRRAFMMAELEQENRHIRELGGVDSGIIGNSVVMDKVRNIIERIAPTEITALLLGESGTGKEVLANAVHKQSNRVKKPFIAINCASIPETLLESELFGFEKGAFTGAHKTTKGKIEMAEGGTLFLDEIGDMPFNLQAKLLRFLQERVIERIGGRQEIPVDVRVVCATNQDLLKMAEQKTFREDLYYRISEMVINIPPLKDRDFDVVVLGRYFLLKFAQDYNVKIKGFTDTAVAALKAHDWPGNIRELQNKIKSAVIMAAGQLISSQDLGFYEEVELDIDQQFNLRSVRGQAESKAIKEAYTLAEGNMSKTAQMLGVTRPTLYGLLEKYDLNLKESV
ncbi:PEP-CTERM-box response regulator transcription factor [Thalassotalea sp. HSM 43]|uniref:PEP-CTERM-box response regulator transcription factor n=1 Tax=Thalassotalea sp. HSM 43 TaxID=2552945 RepID=UPI0010818E0E|nr:PEP-CTERM-box response regulator transcription factor [Thalassotalea sp. HSM 43]QBY04190.1 PEP-CTERM-box response regulator transcription factor [Thalassotalea sp. HSM 43]